MVKYDWTTREDVSDIEYTKYLEMNNISNELAESNKLKRIEILNQLRVAKSNGVITQTVFQEEIKKLDDEA